MLSRQMFTDQVCSVPNNLPICPVALEARILTETPSVIGINFPCYAFENQAETEGFAKMARRAGYQVIGLPNYVVWHIDTDEKAGNV